MNSSKIIIGIVYVGSVAASVQGGEAMTLLTDFRRSTMSHHIAWFDDDGSIPDFDEDFGIIPKPFSDLNFDRTDLISDIGSIRVTHQSQASETELNANGSNHLVSNPDPSIDYLVFSMSAYSQYEITFSIAEETTFALDVELFSSSNDITNVSSMRLRNTDTNALLASATAIGSDAAVHDELTLQAGTYWFFMEARSGFSSATAGDFSTGFSGGLRVVPAPSSLGLLALSGVLSIRRRS
ncbi:MAG: PEP-CTERM sorting domain-containing protein [Phycisphaerales bacterium]|nr:PEP-CTERM sorting domain-containing protein [Phycisphaerales bacterium]